MLIYVFFILFITCSFLLCSAALDNKKENHVEQEMINGYNLSKLSKKITDVMQKNSILER